MKSTVCLPFQCDSSCFEVLPEDSTFEESSKRQARVLSVQCEGESMLTLSYFRTYTYEIPKPLPLLYVYISKRTCDQNVGLLPASN